MSAAPTVRFATPAVRPVAGAGAVGFFLLGLSTCFSSGDNGGPAPLSQIVVGAWCLVFGIVAFVMVVKGYALSVTSDTVVCHGLRDRVIPFSEIESVELARKLVRIFQMGQCLSFRLADGSEYAYKNFNAGLSQTGRGYDRLLQAKELIEQRLSAQRAAPPPPPTSR